MTARTAQLSWLHVWKMWAKVSIWRRSLTFLNATLMCQGIPRLPNQSVWLSRYFLGKYFIAQSCTTNTDDASNDSRISILAASWFKERSMWAFQAWMFALACFTVNKSSSLTSGSRLSAWAINSDSISLRVDISWSQRSQEPLWWWLQWAWKAGSFGSLSANILQWSATEELWHTCTYNTHKINYATVGPTTILILFHEWESNIIYVHEKSKHCETVRRSRLKKKQRKSTPVIFAILASICHLKRNYTTTFYRDKNFSIAMEAQILACLSRERVFLFTYIHELMQ